MAGWHHRGGHIVVGRLLDVGLVELDPVDVHAAPAAVAVRIAYVVGVGLDLYGLARHRDHAFDEVAAVHLGLRWGFEHYDVPALRAVEDIAHVGWGAGTGYMGQKVGIVTEIERLVDQYPLLRIKGREHTLALDPKRGYRGPHDEVQEKREGNHFYQFAPKALANPRAVPMDINTKMPVVISYYSHLCLVQVACRKPRR